MWRLHICFWCYSQEANVGLDGNHWARRKSQWLCTCRAKRDHLLESSARLEKTWHLLVQLSCHFNFSLTVEMSVSHCCENGLCGLYCASAVTVQTMAGMHTYLSIVYKNQRLLAPRGVYQDKLVHSSLESTHCSSKYLIVKAWLCGTERWNKIYCIMGQITSCQQDLFVRVAYLSYRVLSPCLPAPGECWATIHKCCHCHQWCIDLLQC